MLYLILLYSTGNYTSTILTICSIIFVFYILYLFILTNHRKSIYKNNKIKKRIGKKRFDEINSHKSIFDIIFNEILEIDMDLSHPSIHLTPSHNFTGKVKNYWDDHKKRIRYGCIEITAEELYGNHNEGSIVILAYNWIDVLCLRLKISIRRWWWISLLLFSTTRNKNWWQNI